MGDDQSDRYLLKKEHLIRNHGESFAPNQQRKARDGSNCPEDWCNEEYDTDNHTTRDRHHPHIQRAYASGRGILRGHPASPAVSAE
jgi:hypothetical protein